MESLSKSFTHAHGSRLKSAFAEALVKIMHSIGGVSGYLAEYCQYVDLEDDSRLHKQNRIIRCGRNQ